jgi:hypothetical protein
MQHRLIRLAAIAAVITAVACAKDSTTAVPVSKIVTFKSTLSGANEVPANTSTATGTFTATLDTSTNVFTYDVTYTGLGSNVTIGHLHGPAAVGANSGTTINFGTRPGATFIVGATAGTAHGTATLTAATQITATISGDSLKKLLFAGLTYANIHTASTPGGELRGQVTKQ